MGRPDAQDRGQAGGGGRPTLSPSRRSGRLVWLWLLLAWLPVWALFVALILSAHERTTLAEGALISLRMIVAAALLGIGILRLTERLPWPHPFRVRFAVLHLGAAVVYAAAWVLLNSALESAVRRRLVVVLGPGLGAFLVLGVWLYLIVAGVAYAIRGTERAARSEAIAAQSQLAALRAQLNPHFLFNALHTVVQLIPHQPHRAAQAAEQLAGLLRTSLEEDRDLVSLAEEWAFVEQYLEVERLRFGDRLRVRLDVAPAARAAQLPSFALQTLVENAVRHGAAPAVEPTEVAVSAGLGGGVLTVRVSDTGAGSTPAAVEAGPGSGLRRLRERLVALCGEAARLDVSTAPGAGFTATLLVPQEPA